MSALVEELIQITEKCLEQVCSMIVVEQEKRKALLEQDIDRLETVLQQQQAMLMQTDRLEKRRLDAQAAAGYAGLSGTELLAKLEDGDQHRAMETLLTQLRSAAEELQELNHTAMEIAQMNLRLLEQLNHGPVEGNHGLYKPSGKKDGGKHAGRSFEEKI